MVQYLASERAHSQAQLGSRRFDEYPHCQFMLVQSISLQLSDTVVLCRDRLNFSVHYKRPVVAVHADELYKAGQISEPV